MATYTVTTADDLLNLIGDSSGSGSSLPRATSGDIIIIAADFDVAQKAMFPASGVTIYSDTGTRTLTSDLAIGTDSIADGSFDYSGNSGVSTPDGNITPRNIHPTNLTLRDFNLVGMIRIWDGIGTLVENITVDGAVANVPTIAAGRGDPNDTGWPGISCHSNTLDNVTMIARNCTVKNTGSDGFTLAAGNDSAANSRYDVINCTGVEDIGLVATDGFTNQVLTTHQGGLLVVEGGTFQGSENVATATPADTSPILINNATLRNGAIGCTHLINCDIQMGGNSIVLREGGQDFAGRIVDCTITDCSQIRGEARSNTFIRMQLFSRQNAVSNPLITMKVAGSTFNYESCAFIVASNLQNTTAERLLNFQGTVSDESMTVSLKNCTFYGCRNEAIRDSNNAAKVGGILVTNCVFLQCGHGGGAITSTSNGFSSASSNNYKDVGASASIPLTDFANGDAAMAYSMVDYNNLDFRPTGADDTNYIIGKADLNTIVALDQSKIPFGKGEVGAYALPLTATTFFATTTLDGKHPGPLVTRMRKDIYDGKYRANVNLVTGQWFAHTVSVRAKATRDGSDPTSDSTIIATKSGEGAYASINVDLDLSKIDAQPRDIIKYILEFDYNNADTWKYDFRSISEYLGDIEPFEFRNSAHPNSEGEFKFISIADTHAYSLLDKDDITVNTGNAYVSPDNEAFKIGANLFNVKKGIDHVIVNRSDKDFLIFMGDEVTTYQNPPNGLGAAGDDRDADTQARIKLHWTFFRRVFSTLLHKMGAICFIPGNHEAEAGYTQKGSGTGADFNGIGTGTSFKAQQWSWP